MWWTIQDVTAGTAVETYNSDLSHAAARLLPDDFQGRSRLVGGCLVNQILWVPTINNNLAFRSAAGGCFPGDFTARASLIFDFREKWAVFRTQSTLAPALTTIQFEAGPKPTGNWPETLSTLCKNQIPVNAHPDLEWFDVRIHAGRPAVRRVQYWPLTPVKRRSPGSISRSGMLPWTDCG